MQTAQGPTVRDALPGDAPELCDLINRIIRIGGTTAHEEPFSPERFLAHFIAGPDVLCCLVAQDAAGRLAGFQGLGRDPRLPVGWGDIGTFARTEPKTPGTGTALFAATRARLAGLGITAINATIRADNRVGLSYYERIGFQDYDRLRDIPLRDGTRVDRVLKRYPAT